MIKSVLTKDLQKKQILDEFLQHCEKKQVEAIHNNDSYLFCTWIKEARLARRELAALYRAKEKHDEEHKRIKGIVHRLKSIGVNAGVVERAHGIALSEVGDTCEKAL
ncbi:hypothetical protein P4418_02685 [Bacillus thuringiensis]|uniref:hypothetical protein n=1 Tax=Bacillus cereus group TaxID=86661 RepID=UPI0018CCB6C9|nr:hypothetical protein [Bacillus thuringiensis]EKS8370739.1 hypothetical protein [Bacillus cereus]MBG9511743.1 hypothetical protein [Bacillus thuringiensis]MED3387799.1 hypothetical protein [Bacillus thuringiensis]